ncbi:hypothetical protein [Marivivens marinus]|uniref:hypothetical protein n=1 Tax=Marivivens marinus TaxID=3110173 RepID=UPI003B846F48
MFMLIRIALLLWKPLALILLLAMAFPVAAQTERELLVRLIDEYRAHCEATDPEPMSEAEAEEEDIFEIAEDALYTMPVDDDLEALVFHASIRCGYSGWSYNCGTGGCRGHIIVDGQVYDYRGGRPISVETSPGRYTILFSRHGSRCTDAVDPDSYDAPGVAPCYIAASWFQGRFIAREGFLSLHQWRNTSE